MLSASCLPAAGNTAGPAPYLPLLVEMMKLLVPQTFLFPTACFLNLLIPHGSPSYGMEAIRRAGLLAVAFPVLLPTFSLESSC